MPPVGERASGVIDTIASSFKDAPLCFAAVLLAGVFALLTYYATEKDKELAQQRFQQIVGLCWNGSESPSRISQLPH